MAFESKKKRKPKSKLIKRTDQWLLEVGGGGLKWVKGIKTNKFPVIKYVSDGDVTYRTVTVVNNFALHT